MSTVKLFTAANGRTFAVASLEAGDTYGASGGLVADQPLVEFWDTTHPFANVRDNAPYRGQFTGGRYHRATLLEGVEEHGLQLMGSEPAWTIDGTTMGAIRTWLREQ